MADTARAVDEAVRQTRERIESSWRSLMDALDGVPEDRLDEAGVAGEWSIKDVMGHVAFWDEQAVLAAQQYAQGQPDREVDWQALNEQEAAAGKGRSAGEQRDAMTRAHARVVSLLDELPPADPANIGRCGCLQGDTYQHYDEHAADIRAWRNRVGIDALPA